jgi:hypothetical protein
MDIINTLLDAGVDPSPELNMHRPSRGGNSGRFTDNQLSTGCTPLFRAIQANDLEVIRALMAKRASPNVNAMGFTPFLLAAGVNPGGRGGGAGGPANTTLLDLLLQGGANVNAQVTGTKTYTMRVSRAPSNNEGMSALHAAVQAGRVDVVRYLLDKGANPELADSTGRKPIDMLGGGAAAGGGRAGVAPVAPPANAAPAAAGARGGPVGVSPASAAEIRLLLQNAPVKK